METEIDANGSSAKTRQIQLNMSDSVNFPACNVQLNKRKNVFLNRFFLLR